MIAMIVLPIRAARVTNARAGLKRAVTTTLVFNVLWAAVVLGVFFFLLRNPAALAGEGVRP
jgi:hypothetical protein